jgi:hypothetical protein
VTSAAGPEPPPVRVAVVGAGRATDRERELAYELGAALAGAGAVVVSGGLGGVMEAAARGASEAGGLTLGILPGADPAAANRWIALPIATGMGEARNALVVRAAEAVVAVGGAWGTLSEVALARKTGVPVATLAAAAATAGLGLPDMPDPRRAAAWALEAARAWRLTRGSPGASPGDRS